MNQHIYFDTNVIVDLFDSSRPFHKYSVEVFRTIFADETMDVYVNTDTMTNLFYILRSHVKLSFDEAVLKIEFIKNSFSIVSSTRTEIEATVEICKNMSLKTMKMVCNTFVR